jgi:hypothetical protein
MGLLSRRPRSSPTKAAGRGTDVTSRNDALQHNNGQQNMGDSKDGRNKKYRSSGCLRYFNVKFRSQSIATLFLAATFLLACVNKLGTYTKRRKSVAHFKFGSLRKTSLSPRQHIMFYLNINTNHYVTRPILVTAPSYRKELPQHLNYFDSDDRDPTTARRINFNDPDDGEAFPIHEKDRQCHPMASWQTENHQTCNTVHEIEMDADDDGGDKAIQFINCGNSRCTFLIPNDVYDDSPHDKKQKTHSHKNKSNKIVLKVTKNKRWGFDPDKYDMAVKDSLALERLTSSPYAVDIYASCAVSQLVEYSKGGNIHDLLKRSRLDERVGDGPKVDEKKESLLIHFANPAEYKRHQLTTPLTKLKIAYQVATAVADMHALEDHPDGLPSMVHNDLCCHQFMFVDGIYKLGDFDWVTFQTQRSLGKASSTSNGQIHASHESPRKQQTHDEEVSRQDVCQTTPIQFALEYLKVLSPEELSYYEELKQARENLLDEGENPVLLESAENAKPGRTYRDKLDIYQVGNICYTLLTNWWMWEGYTIDHALLATHQVRQYFDSICMSVFRLERPPLTPAMLLTILYARRVKSLLFR